jgi:preprotein translocase subunit SecE
MSKEKTSAVSPLFRELFQLGFYKRSQGRIARRITLFTIVGVVALGAWRMSMFAMTMNVSRSTQVFVPTVLVVLGTWLAFRLVNLPSFADFLIAVEAEMNKVSWPTRNELVRSSLVVMFCIFFLAIVLYGYDLFWSTLLHLLRVVGS